MGMLMKNNDRGLVPGNPMNDLMRTMFSGFPDFPHWHDWIPESRMTFKVNDKDVKVKFPCAGCKRSDFEIETEGSFITVKVAKRSEPAAENGRHYTCRERSWEEYQESVKLPVDVKSSEAKAKYADGVLEITVPRAESKKPASKLIEVK